MTQQINELINTEELYAESEVLCSMIEYLIKEYRFSDIIYQEANDNTSTNEKKSFFKKILDLIKSAGKAIVSFFKKIGDWISSKVFIKNKTTIIKFTQDFSESDVKSIMKSLNDKEKVHSESAVPVVIDAIDKATFGMDIYNTAKDLRNTIKQNQSVEDQKEKAKNIGKVGAEAGVKIGVNAALGTTLGPIGGNITYTGLDILYHILKHGHQVSKNAWINRKGFNFIQSCLLGIFIDLDEATDDLMYDAKSIHTVSEAMKKLMNTAYSKENKEDIQKCIDELSKLERIEDPDNPDAIQFILHIDEKTHRKLSERASKLFDRISKMCADPDKFLPIRMLEKKESRDKRNQSKLTQKDIESGTNYGKTIQNEFVRYVMTDLKTATKILSLVDKILVKNRKRINKLSELCEYLRFNYRHYKKISTKTPYRNK